MNSYIPNVLANGITSGLIENAENIGYDINSVRGTMRDNDVSKFLRGGDIVGKILKGNNKIVNGLDDPSNLGFMFILEPVFLNNGLFGGIGETSNVLGITDIGYSALLYLKDCVGSSIDYEDSGIDAVDENGMPVITYDEITEQYVTATEKYPVVKSGSSIFLEEYKNMQAFVNGFNTIVKEYPYVFQTIEGLAEAYTKYFENKKDSFLGGGEDNKIKIGCLESMDLRMLALFNSYFNAVYNHKYRRQIVPTNLLKFNCGILVHDLRNVVVGAWETTPLLTPENANFISKNISTVYFKFIDCIIDTENIGESFANVGNNEANVTNFSFSFEYNNVEIYVNSLADALESGSKIEKNKILESNKIHDIELARAKNKRKYFDNNDYNVYFNYNNGIPVGEALMNFGQQVFNSATSSTKFGNVYDESKYGVVSNMLSTITNASSSSILASLAKTGKDYLGEKIMENLPSGNFANTVGNMIGYPKTKNTGENVFKKEQHREPVKTFGESVLLNPPSGPRTKTL